MANSSVNEAIRRAAGRQDPDEKTAPPKPKAQIEPSVLADRIDSALLALGQLGEELKAVRSSVVDEDEEVDEDA